MRDHGFTLVETLGALAILSLVVSSVVAAMAVYGRQQATALQQMADTDALRGAQAALERILAPQGPYRSDQTDRLSGSSSRIQFDCGQAAPCAAEIVGASKIAIRLTDNGVSRQLPLRLSGPAHFAYESEAGVGSSWPPPPGTLQHLQTVAVVRDGDPSLASLLKVRIWRQEAVSCQFDPVSQDCR